MTRKNLISVFCSAVLAVAVLPQAILAQNLEEISPQDQEKYQELSQYETQTLLEDLIPQALTDNWIGQITSGSSDKFSSAVAATLRGFVRHNFSRYLLTDVPLDAAKTVVLQGVEIGKIVYSDGWDDAMAGVLGKFEKDSVSAAVSYVKSQLVKYGIKMVAGAFEAQYESEGGSQEKALLQYVVVYKPDGDEKADVSIRFYSINSINPPSKGLSLAGMTGVVHDLQPGEKIPPFTATFSGSVQKARYGGTVYSWDGEPEISIFFPGKVIDFGFRPVSWWDKNVVNPIKGAIGSIGNFFNNAGQNIGKLFGAQMVATSDLEQEEDGAGEAQREETLSMNPVQDSSNLFNGATDKSSLQDRISSSSNQGGLKFLGDPAGNDGNQTLSGGQLGVSASIEEPSNEENGGAPIGQLTEQERQEMLRLIALEIARRQQEEQQAKDKETQLRAVMIAMIEKLQSGSAQDEIVDDEAEDAEDIENSEADQENDEEDGSDGAGGTDLCLFQSGQTAQMNKVVINEIAWMGSQAGSTREWMELKNLTGQAIDLDGWQLQDKDQQIQVIFGASSRIGAGQFFLLERTSDDAAPGIAANVIYKGSLANSNEALYLFDPDCRLQDKAEASPSWPAGSDSQKRTMERGADLSWHTYAGLGQNNIFGTPKAANGPAAVQSSGGSGGGGSGSTSGNSSSTSNSSSTQQSSSQAQNQEPASEPQAIDRLIISEIMLADSQGREYAELYNPTDQEADLCADPLTAFYFAYYSATRDWNNPYRIKSFCDSPSSTATVIPAKGYYLIGFNDHPQSDWPMYSSDLLSDSSGAIAIFSGDPRNATGTAEEIAASITLIKIDAVGWKKDSGSTEPLVKETGAALVPDQEGQALGRLWHLASQKYQDTDDNFKDFGSYDPSPGNNLSYSPEAITDLSVRTLAGRKNGAKLVWSAPNDKDSGPDQLSYQIFYTRDQVFSTGTMAGIEEETDPLVTKSGEEVTAEIKGLYYDSAYYFAIQAVDDKGNKSPLSTPSQVFNIDKANHPWPMARHDAGLASQGEFGGPVGDREVSDFTATGGMFFAPPVIDENGSAFFAANIGGKEGIYSFSAEGKQEWFFQAASSGRVPALNGKGLVYFFAPYGAGALSPSGRFKWSENFNSIYSSNPVAGPDGRLYLIAKTESQIVPHLLALADGEGQAVRSIDYDLSQELEAGEEFSSVLGPMLDGQGNIYLAINKKIVKLNSSGQKTDERTFEPDYDQDYEGSKDVVVLAGMPYLFDSNRLITVISNGHCGKLADPNGGEISDLCESTAYSLSLEDLSQEDWKKNICVANWAEVMGDNLYFIFRGSSWLGSGWQDLIAVDLASGDTLWTKRWANDYNLGHVYSLLADGQGHVYFAQGDKVLGYDLGQVLDSDPDSGLIFKAAASHITSNTSGGSLGGAGLFVPAREKMSLIRP